MKTWLFALTACHLGLASVTGQQAAPSILWQRSLGGFGDDFLYVVRETRDGGILVGGSSESPAWQDKTAPTYGGPDFWITKLDGAGNHVWDRAFGGTTYDRLRGIDETSDGGIILSGSSQSGIGGNKTTTHFGPSASGDFWVLRLDAYGMKSWEQNIGGAGPEDYGFVWQTSDAGFILAGTSSGATTGTPGGTKTATNWGVSDYYIVRLDDSGNILWDRSFGGADNDICWDLCRTHDGGFVLAGGSRSSPSGNKTSPNFGEPDFWVVRLDPNGNKLWERSFGGSGDDVCYSVRQMPDGGFALGGRSLSPPSGNKTSPDYGNGDWWLVRLNAEGDKEWERTFGGTNIEYLYSIDVTRDGGLVLGGFSSSEPGGDKTGPKWGRSDYWVIRLDADGQKLWDATYGGTHSEQLQSIQQTRDGGFILGGWSYSPAEGNKTVPQFFFSDFWVLKLGPEQPRLALTGQGIGTDGVRFVLNGVKNLEYVIEYSADLHGWTSLETNRLNRSQVELRDSTMTQAMQRFYRARRVP